MKAHTIITYDFDELSEEAKQKAINQERNNPNYLSHEWWDRNFDEFKTLCKNMGVEVDNIYFNGFYTQGGGSKFTASIDPLLLLLGADCDSYKFKFPKLELNIPIFELDKRVEKLIESGFIIFTMNINNSNGYYLNVGYDWEYYKDEDYDNIKIHLNKLGDFLESVLNILNEHLYNSLQNEHDYLMSDGAIIQSLINNEYEFLESGEMYN